MQHVSTLITQHQQESNEQSRSADKKKNEMPKGLTPEHLDLLWLRMAKIYGHKWVSSFGENDDGTWLKGLWDIAPQQIGAGLERCRTSSEPWPPTLPEFRAMCLPEKIPAYHRPYVALPKPEPNPELVDRSIGVMRTLLAVMKKSDAA